LASRDYFCGRYRAYLARAVKPGPANLDDVLFRLLGKPLLPMFVSRLHGRIATSAARQRDSEQEPVPSCHSSEQSTIGAIREFSLDHAHSARKRAQDAGPFGSLAQDLAQTEPERPGSAAEGASATRRDEQATEM
jgi:hypothetical protein